MLEFGSINTLKYILIVCLNIKKLFSMYICILWGGGSCLNIDNMLYIILIYILLSISVKRWVVKKIVDTSCIFL